MKIPNDIFIEKNPKLFEGLEPGKIYSVFENSPLCFYGSPESEIFTRYTKLKSGVRSTKRVNCNGNKSIIRIAICGTTLDDGSICQEKKAGWITNSQCKECHAKRHVIQMRTAYHDRKASPKKKQRVVSSVYIKTGKEVPFFSSKALQTAYSITGPYPKVPDAHYEHLPSIDRYDEIMFKINRGNHLL